MGGASEANGGVDPVRLLAARSELGYTDSTCRAMRGEPEAVPADYQRWLTRQARVRAEQAARHVDRRAEELDR